MVPLDQKNITAEVCVHHLHFTSDDYATLGNRIKCNPAIKAPHNRTALWQALLDDRLDVIATDHAPIPWKKRIRARSRRQPTTGTRQWRLRKITCRLTPGTAFPAADAALCTTGRHFPGKSSRKNESCCGYLLSDRRQGIYTGGIPGRSGDRRPRKSPYTITPGNILYKCGWSPLEGFTFPATVTNTFVNGHMVYGNGVWDESQRDIDYLLSDNYY